MAVVELDDVTVRYGRRAALVNVDLAVPAGAFYSVLGPNGAGKTTLLNLLIGVLRPHAGRVTVLGRSGGASAAERMRIGYIAEGQRLPRLMSARDLQRYLAPLYPSWDAGLADELRARFRIDDHRRIGRLSRGEQMKVALLCALAPRPELLLMDEPFTGMDVVVKDELVRGLLGVAAGAGTTVIVSSHDLTELESLADHVGFLDGGRLLLSESMDALRRRFKRAEIVAVSRPVALTDLPPTRLLEERAGPRVTFLISDPDDVIEADLRSRLGHVGRIDFAAASLRDVFVALARRPGAAGAERPEVVA